MPLNNVLIGVSLLDLKPTPILFIAYGSLSQCGINNNSVIYNSKSPPHDQAAGKLLAKNKIGHRSDLLNV